MGAVASRERSLNRKLTEAEPSACGSRFEPRSKALRNELMRVPQPLLLCYPGTFRPQYMLALDSEHDVRFSSATTKHVSGACSVDALKTTKDVVTIRGSTGGGSRLKVKIRRHPEQGKD